MTRTVTLIPGDGIGPEITAAALRVLEAAGADITWDRQLGGMAALEATGNPLPGETIESVRRHRVVLKGPLTTPVGTGFRSVNVALRKEFDLYANVRPTRTIIPGGRYEDVDIVLVRENTEGLYIGFETYITVAGDPRAVAQSTAIVTRQGCERIVRYAFEYAVRHDRRLVTVVHKANILKTVSGLFLDVAREVAEEYHGRVAMNDVIIDACAMKLVLDPGQGVANPTALLLGACMMLDHLGDLATATRVRTALERTLRDDGVRTRDVGGNASTDDFTDAVVRRLA